MTSTPIKRIPVDSSSLAAIGYSHDESVLDVEFRSAELFRFFLVPAAVWEDFLEADSKGGYFNDCVNGRYPFTKLPRADAPDTLHADLERSLAAFRGP